MWKKIFLIGLMGAILANCTTAPDFSGMTVRQGNLLSQAKLQRLKIGMTKEEVTLIMGDSLLSSPFNQNRWDYADTRRKGSGDMKIKHVSLYFTEGRLTNIVKQ